MYLFFDTETTGRPRRHDAPASDVDNWPRLVQIAWLLTDASGNELRSEGLIIRPDGFEIPPSATRIHGITTGTARRLGIELRRALTAFANDLSRAEVLVGHNVQFDERVVGAEFFRTGQRKNPLDSKTRYCTMRSSRDFCRIPGGPRGYKWPTLEQLHVALFGVAFKAAHNAVADVQACARCFFELERQRVVSGDESPDDDDELLLEDQDLFDEIYSLAGLCPWFDTGRFVDDVHEQFQNRGFITHAQRDALMRIRDMLGERA
ncbi:MAG: 3'-5' exonuclease [Candidatus Methylomirabilia bacterium]